MSRGPYSNCKSCGTAIIWLTMRSGKSIPVLRMDRNEQAVRPGEVFDRLVHEVHFADCKNADAHRKPREKAPPKSAPRAQEPHQNWPGSYRKPEAPPAAERLPIFGLSLPQPWAWAVAWGGWRLLYQPWVPNRPAPWWIAIHATTEYDVAAAEWLTARLAEQEQTADQLGVPEDRRGPVVIPPPHQLHRGHVVAVARYAGIQGDAAEGPLFAAGPDVWIVDSVTAINPIPCPPGRALWTVPGDVLAMLRAAWAAARRAPLTGPPPVTQTGQPDYQWSEQ